MKILTSILLVFMILGHSFNNWGIYISYSINKDFIKEVLCINKENTSMQCDGKCFIKSSVEKSQNSKPSKNMPSPDLINSAFIFPLAIEFEDYSVLKGASKNVFVEHLIGRNFLGKLLRPPPFK